MASTVIEQAIRARNAARALALASRAEKDAALQVMADALVAETASILTANEHDLKLAAEGGTSTAYLDRLKLTAERIEGMANGLRQVASLVDPVGDVIRSSTMANGLELRQVRVPFGVIGMIYEARPNVTVDAAGICLKSGNAVLLRGSNSAANSNQKLVDVMRSALERTSVPRDAIQLVSAADRSTVKELLTARGYVDLVIPRGGAELIKTVIEESRVPVIETGVGNCHIYIDENADLSKATPIIINAKVQRPSVCNAAETILIHRAIATQYLPSIIKALHDQGVTIHGDQNFVASGDQVNIKVLPATEEDWGAEYGSLDIAARVVDSLDDAVTHIRTYGTSHTEAIITESTEAANRFIATCDSAAIMVNASTRFTDGEEFGFGAEIGISTQKLHARGPMGLAEMTSTTWIVTGNGQIR
jgi:glutamate-5-semialdehyde dehydrogenase